MKKLFITAVAAFALLPAVAQTSEAPLWLRYAAISPDGSRIAFTYKGDIYTVPTTGGTATQLTSNRAYDSYPVWSPDGRRIAFGSDREGGIDIFIVDSNGGTPRRLTTHSSREVPMAFADSTHILFSANEQQSILAAQGGFNSQTYTVATDGKSRPTMLASWAMESISPDGKGRYLFNDVKGFENKWRKHEKSSATSDIWLATADSKSNGGFRFQKLTGFGGTDRNPVWGDGDEFYYLSEEDGTMNVYKQRIDGSGKQQLTHFTKNPVRFLSRAANGMLAFGYDGELYTLREGGTPQKLAVKIVGDNYQREAVAQLERSGATSISVAPSGEEIAFVLRGDIYVTSVKYKTTKRITDTPEQERTVDFAPDGRSLVYDSERNGLWQIYESKIKDKKEKNFTYCTDIEETQLVKSDKTSFQPAYSPDGKEVAFLENRQELKVINLKSKKTRTALDGKFNYSYADGDVTFEWSPDSKWFLTSYIGVGGWNNMDIALVKADGTEVHDLTESGYSDSNPKWAMGGKAMTWTSDRNGYRSHGSWGAESDVFIMFFDADAYDRFNMTEEEAALYDEAEKDKKGDKKKDKDKKDEKEDKKKDKKVEDLKFDLENRKDRVRRLTGNSSSLGDYYLNEKADKLYYITAFEKDGDLWEANLKDGSMKILAKGIGYGTITPTEKGDKLFVRNYRGINSVELPSGTRKAVEYEAKNEYRPAAERKYIFDHAWQQVKDKFYDPKLHGVDWEGYKKTYERFLPHINNNYDYAEMLSELLGELNASHTGSGYGVGTSQLRSTAYLGAFFDDSWTGDGLKIKEVIRRGPLMSKNTGIKAGDIILAIDGDTIHAGKDYYPLLAGKAGNPTRLTVKDAKGKERYVTVKPVSSGMNSYLMYRRWVDRNKAIVDSVSGGRIGYVHIQGMNSSSYRTIFEEILGKYRNCDAIVVDTRYNGGGWLHDDVVTLLSGKEYVRFSPRGQYIGSEPHTKWTKPSVMLVNESNYSDAHGTPYAYKTLGVGKVVGTPVPGTMTAVWWETQVDPSLYFGIPQVTSLDMHGEPLENKQLEPDVLIYNAPSDVLQGIDRQLIEATKLLMQKK